MSALDDRQSTVPAAYNGLRLDQAVSRLFAISRRHARRIIDLGGVYVDRHRCRMAGRIVHQGSRIRIVELDEPAPPALASEQICWQQGDLVLLHKRSGQYSQEALHRSRGCLPDELKRLLGRPFRPVHRLDRGTSGLILFCADGQLHAHLQRHWGQCAKKAYLAVVSPAPSWDETTIEMAIGTKRDRLGRYHPDPEHGRHALTQARMIERRQSRALLMLQPITGRTHQLRVHLSALGCPILGDTRYGGRPHSRMMLHAWRLKLEPPALPEVHDWEIHPQEDWKW